MSDTKRSLIRAVEKLQRRTADIESELEDLKERVSGFRDTPAAPAPKGKAKPKRESAFSESDEDEDEEGDDNDTE